MTRTTSPGGSIVSHIYDGVGRRLSTVQPRGNVGGANPEQYRARFTYDAGGNLLTAGRPSGAPVFSS